MDYLEKFYQFDHFTRECVDPNNFWYKSVECAQPSTESVSSLVRANSTQVFKSTLRSGAPVAAGLFIAETGLNAYRYINGEIDREELKCRAVESGASNSGGLLGTATGAALGTIIFPGVGTYVGGALGGMLGGYFARKAAGNLIRQGVRA